MKPVSYLTLPLQSVDYYNARLTDLHNYAKSHKCGTGEGTKVSAELCPICSRTYSMEREAIKKLILEATKKTFIGYVAPM